MKKFLISLNLIILAHFFTIFPAYCEEDFFTNGDEFIEAKEKNIITKKISNFKKKLDKRAKQKKIEEGEIPKGYYGTLPKIEADFEYKKPPPISNSSDNFKMMDAEDMTDENLKSAPFNDALFLDVIIKKEKTSQYVNDLQKIKFALNNIKKCLEEKGDIQRFNACVNVFDLYIQNLQKKYSETSTSLKESYIALLETNYQAKVLGNLKYDSNYYSRLIPTQQGQYSDENIELENEKLLNKINKTLFLINGES